MSADRRRGFAAADFWIERMLTETAPAKINLALHVRRRRPDGYHDIETVFAFLRDADRVTIAPAASDGFAVTGPFATDLSDPSDNLVLDARDGFAARIAPLPPLAITLDKQLPVASGIGGGSADAAAALRALARLAGVAHDNPGLVALAGDLGADVPACLLGTTAFGSGKGEALRPIAGVGGTPVLLVNPGIAVSTATVFAGWDGVDRGPLGDWRDGRNDLEPPARAIAPAIDAVLAALRACPGGATLVRMSGSGATCFALFDAITARDAASAAIGSAHPGWWRLASTLA